ncbi:hypothetical protein M426DRAFT_320777 [Hypoxylon sp. CI-4A]|nr:hypothetical protein M426DRAFT_320777 [Hypoxylon sp. CI-4A]
MRSDFTISALAVAAVQVGAQDSSNTIVGCVELGCPSSNQDTVNDNCTIADTGSFPLVGATQVPSTEQSLSGLSWVKGFNLSDSHGNYTFHNSFYLGASPDLKLNASTGGCAVFLNGPSSSLTFGTNDTNDDTSQGTCNDAMGSSCVDAIVKRAQAQITDYYGTSGQKPSNSEACAMLQKDLQSSVESECERIAQGVWSDFTGVALTGDDAPEPISQQQKSSSACWPVTSKEDSLMLVSEYHSTAADFVENAEKAQWAITPILTVFYPVDNGSVTTEVDASLSCVKVMGPAKASLDTMSNGTDDTGGAYALSSSFSLVSAALYMVIAALFMSYVV